MSDTSNAPSTASGKALYDDVRIHNVAQRTRADDKHDSEWLARIRKIEDEAAAGRNEWWLQRWAHAVHVSDENSDCDGSTDVAFCDSCMDEARYQFTDPDLP